MNKTCWNSFLRHYSRIRLLAKWARRRSRRSQSISFMRGFIRENDLVFDIGANYGWKTELFLSLGARVIAVEPQTECIKVLCRKFGHDPSVVIEPFAAGSSESRSKIWKSDVRNQLSSMDPEWISAVKDSGRFSRFEWSSTESVNVTTLDRLIGKHGLPAFCKIDTEGYELNVIKGLSQAINVISLEYHAEFIKSAFDSLEIIDSLGDYHYNYTVGERPGFAGETWTNSEAVLHAIASEKSGRLQGDIYARKVFPLVTPGAVN